MFLPSGGHLVIDRTEAMTVIDVNTGKYTGAGGNLEETVTRNNLEAAEEIVRQLRLRDLGGIVVIDFIDMVLESNRELVLRRLTECLGRDRTKHQVTEITSLGLVQMTRKRIGAGPAGGVQRDLRALQGPRRDHPHRAGAGERPAATTRREGQGGGGRRRPRPTGRSTTRSTDGGRADDADRGGRRRHRAPGTTTSRASPTGGRRGARRHAPAHAAGALTQTGGRRRHGRRRVAPAARAAVMPMRLTTPSRRGGPLRRRRCWCRRCGRRLPGEARRDGRRAASAAAPSASAVLSPEAAADPNGCAAAGLDRQRRAHQAHVAVIRRPPAAPPSADRGRRGDPPAVRRVAGLAGGRQGAAAG